MKKVFTLLAVLFTVTLVAQTPAGNSFYISLAEFNADGLVRYFNCGNDASVNPTDEVTIEVWYRPRETDSNQKLVGKVDISGAGSGYMLGVDQGNCYPEAWNGNHYEVQDGFLPPVNTYWIHLAMTYKRGEKLIAYVNGENVGEEVVADNPLASNTNELAIGIAPWDLANFQTWGQMDEVRVWDVARTEAEIRAEMHRTIDPFTTGLVAYYDFNETDATSMTDMSLNNNDCTLNNKTDSTWMESWAPIGNATAQDQTDLTALWSGNGFINPIATVTENGLSMVGDLNLYEYVAFGHNDGNGTATSDIPAGAPANFTRAGRIWYTNPVGTDAITLTFALDDAAAGGTQLSNASPASHYTLLKRDGTTGDFEPVTAATSITNDNVTFLDVNLTDGYYTIGVGDDAWNLTGVAEITTSDYRVAPNPSNGWVYISKSNAFIEEVEIVVVNTVGQEVHREIPVKGLKNQLALDLSHLSTGIYFVRMTAKGQTQTSRVVLE